MADTIDGTTKLRRKSIPNVETERLHLRLQYLHDLIHTVEGMHVWEEGRRALIEQGITSLMIRDELVARNEPLTIDCRCCGGKEPA